MSSLPLQAILFWIAVTLAPPDTSQILVKGPDATWAWTKQTAGWSVSADRSVWIAEGKTVTTASKGKKEKREENVAKFVQGVKDHDWKESGTIKLQSSASLAKEGETYVYTVDEGSDTAKRFVIRFRRNPAAAKGAVELGYVGETSDDKRSFADSGHAIAFDRPADAKYLSAIQIYASRYGLPQPPREDFHVYVLDKDQKVIHDFLFPYSLFARGPQRWCTLDLPATEVPERFYVALAFHAEQTKGIYLGLDKNVRESHSFTGLPADGFEPVAEKYDWMVRARLVSDPSILKSRPGTHLGRPVPVTASASHGPSAPVSPDAIPSGATRLSYVGETSEDKRSLGGSGHAVAFHRPEKTPLVVAIQIYASRYGLPEPPAEDFHVWLLDKDRKVLKDFPFAYAKIARGPMRWYTLKLPPTEVPEHFYVALSFNPEQTKGIYLGLDKTGKESHSYIGLPEAGYEPVDKQSDWMVRVYLAADADNILSNPGAEKGDEQPDDWTQGAQVEGVKYAWDKKVAFEGKASLCIAKTANRYFPIAQWSQTVDRIGDLPSLEVSAEVKAAKTSKAVVDVVFLDKDGQWISHHWAAYIGSKEQGDSPADHDWKKYCGTVEIPPGTARICVALQDYGPGKVWFDDICARYVASAAAKK